jgi:hypothetical protein
MGMISTILVCLGAIIGTVFVKLLADEAKAWLPHIIETLVLRAVKQLPEADRERFSEEWRSDLNETPGDLTKLVNAIGFLIAARRIRAHWSTHETTAAALLRCLKTIQDYSGNYHLDVARC